MILAVPRAAPVTMPVVPSTGAMAVLLLVQVPPGVVLINAMDVLRQAEVAPVIVGGSGFTVTVLDIAQPVGKI